MVYTESSTKFVEPCLGITEEKLKGYDRSNEEHDFKMLQHWPTEERNRATHLALNEGDPVLEAQDRITAEAVARYDKDKPSHKLLDISTDKLFDKKKVCYNLCIIPGDHNKTKEN